MQSPFRTLLHIKKAEYLQVKKNPNPLTLKNITAEYYVTECKPSAYPLL